MKWLCFTGVAQTHALDLQALKSWHIKYLIGAALTRAVDKHPSRYEWRNRLPASTLLSVRNSSVKSYGVANSRSNSSYYWKTHPTSRRYSSHRSKWTNTCTLESRISTPK